MAQDQKYLTIQQAAQRLGVDRRRVWQLIKTGLLGYEVNPLDRRSKLIPVGELEKLAGFPMAPKRRTEATDKAVTPEEATAVEHQANGESHQEPSPSRPRPRTIAIYKGSVRVMGDEVEDYLRDHWKPDW